MTPLSPGAPAAKLSRDMRSASTGGKRRSAVSGGAGDCRWVSGSTGIGRFLKGSLKEDLSAGRLRVVPVSEPGATLSTEQRFSKLSVPVHAGCAGELPVIRESPTRPMHSGLFDPSLPRSRFLVRRSSGAGATVWWSPFMVMILGINWERVARDLKKFQVCALEDNFSTSTKFSWWNQSIHSGQYCAISIPMKSDGQRSNHHFPFVSPVYFRFSLTR